MVRWIVQQLDDITGVVDEVYEALEELRTHATAFRSIVAIDRIIHHATIIEIEGDSYQKNSA
jgi:DNA replication protein DnaC